jgi:hypothetical protein
MMDESDEPIEPIEPIVVRGPSLAQRRATAFRVRRYLTRRRFMLDPEQVANCYDYLDQLESTKEESNAHGPENQEA